MLLGFLVGVLIRRVLPENHTNNDSRDMMKTAAGLMATLIALVIGLLVSSAKNAFDTANANVTQAGAKIITLDRTLKKCGPGASGAREQLLQTVTVGVERMWPTMGKQKADLTGFENATGMEDLFDKIQTLTPQNDSQQYHKAQALQLCTELMHSRWMTIEQTQNALPTAFLVVLVFWLTVLFMSFGLLTPRNLTAISAFCICAVSMAAAVFLIMELNHPLDGLIQVSNAPMLKALSLIGK
jgi:hypothetical protein